MTPPYERVTDRAGDTQLTRSTPEHKVNVGGRAALPHRVTIAANAGYKDGSLMRSPSRSSALDVPAYWRLDLRVGYRPIESTELFLIGQNLGRPLHREFPDGLDVARSIYGGVRVTF